MMDWKGLLARFKPRLNYEDARRICVSFAENTRDTEPVKTALNYLKKGDDSQDWFLQWQIQAAPILKKISEGKSRKEQAHLCRIEMLQIEEARALNAFILSFEKSPIRDVLLTLKYLDHPDLSDGELWSTFIMHYTYSLLNSVGISCLYGQQWNRFLPLDDFEYLYRAICGSYVHLLCYTFVMGELAAGHESQNVRSMAQIYLDKVSPEVLENLRQGKVDFEEWMKAGHVHGMEEIRVRFLGLIDKYSDACDASREAMESLPERLS